MAISFQDADKFRLKHAEELLALFEGARGHPARTTDELAQWLDSVDDDLADEIAREVAEEAGRKAGREAAKKNGREAYEEASYRAYERACSAIAGCRKRRVRIAPEAQAIFCCRRHQPRWRIIFCPKYPLPGSSA